MNYGIIIKLSRSKIAFLCNRAEKNGLFPFDGNRPVLPLAIMRKEDDLVIGEAAVKAYQTGAKDAFIDIFSDIKRPGTFTLKGQEHSYADLLLLAIEKHISDFLAQAYLLQGTTYEAVKKDLPIGFIFNDCLSQGDKDQVKNLFLNHGYQNTAEIDANTYFFPPVGRRNVLVVAGDGRDLSLKLYDRESKKVKQTKSLPHAGADPRVEAVARLFHSIMTPPGMSWDKAKPVLESEAVTVLERNPAEYEGHVNVDGLPCEFFVSRREVEKAVTAIVGSAENLGIAEFVREQGSSMDDCSMFIGSSLTTNSYFRQLLTASYPDANLVDEKLEEKVMNDIDKLMRDNKFAMRVLDIDTTDTDGGSGINIVDPGNNTLDPLPKKNIKATLFDTYIKFDILIPQGARYVELFRRDGGAPKTAEQLVERVLPTIDEDEQLESTTFTDSGLKERAPYLYNFVAVYFDEFGNELRTKDLELQYTTVPRVVNNKKPIEIVVSKDDEQSASLEWNEQRGAKLKLFTDDEPYTYQSGDLITNETDIHGTLINLADKKHHVNKDYHGERFFLPVTVRDGIMTAGNPVCVQSNPRLRGFKAEYDKAADAVSISWEWGALRDVLVVWQYPNDNRVPEKLSRNENEGHVNVARTPKHSQVLVEACPVFTSKVDGNEVKGISIKRTVDIPRIGIDVTGVRNDGRGKFTCHIGCSGATRVPCDLRLLVSEGEADFDNPDATIDIKKEQWQQGRIAKQFSFNRKRATNDLNVRIESIDDEYADRLNFVRQEFTLAGEEEKVEPTFTEKPSKKEPTFTDNKDTGGGGGSSKTWLYILLVAVVAAIIYFLYPKLTGGKEGGNTGETPDSTIVDTPDSKEKEKVVGQTPDSKDKGKKDPKSPGDQSETPKHIDCDNISITQSSLTLTLGSQNTLNVRKTPQKADEEIIWESSNPSVATVNPSGKVVAQSEGTATVTATTSRTGLKAQTTVTVKPLSTTPPPPDPEATVTITTNIPTSRIVKIVINGQEYGTVPTKVKLETGKRYTFVGRVMDKKGKKVEAEYNIGTVTITGDRTVPINVADPTIF